MGSSAFWLWVDLAQLLGELTEWNAVKSDYFNTVILWLNQAKTCFSLQVNGKIETEKKPETRGSWHSHGDPVSEHGAFPGVLEVNIAWTQSVSLQVKLTTSHQIWSRTLCSFLCLQHIILLQLGSKKHWNDFCHFSVDSHQLWQSMDINDSTTEAERQLNIFYSWFYHSLQLETPPLHLSYINTPLKTTSL